MMKYLDFRHLSFTPEGFSSFLFLHYGDEAGSLFLSLVERYNRVPAKNSGAFWVWWTFKRNNYRILYNCIVNDIPFTICCSSPFTIICK